MAKRTDDEWKLVKEGFVAGFLYAYNDAKKTANTGFDGKAIKLFAERQAIEHVALLKASEK
jgi:hypothetical protein